MSNFALDQGCGLSGPLMHAPLDLSHELPFGRERSGASLAGVAWGAHQNCNYVYVMGWSYVSNSVRGYTSTQQT